ncbi:MAG TPA: hypothetical protein VN374_06280 [Desulfitobacteriaceae bacterium]|nr:hypothetical protein [Desulfitobacteriaceae bacterium]
MAKNEIYVCDYELCGHKGINDEGGLPVNWFELTVVNKSGKKTFHLCPKHEVIITDPWGGSWLFDHTKIKDDSPEDK